MFTSRSCTSLFAFILFMSLCSSAAAVATAASDNEPGAKLHPVLLERLAHEEGPAKAWVFFTDKGVDSQEEYAAAIQQVAANYNQRAVWRRAMRGDNARRGGALFDEHDLPLVESYVAAVAATGAKIHITSTWLNALSAYVTLEQAEQIATLPFVDRLEAVGRSRRVEPIEVRPRGKEEPQPAFQGRGGLNYGLSGPQLQQINLIALHDEGYTGQGVIIGILDTGFERSHVAFNNPTNPVTVIAEYDFIDDDANTAIEPGDPSSQHSHGTMILGCIGSYQPGDLVGGAFSASFILTKTEDTTGEYPAEEDNYVAGLQFIEANGGDMTTSSLGYIDWYTQADLDGQTAVTTIAVNISTSLGIHHCNAAGNEYHDSDPGTSHLIAPADAFQCITCGAVDSSGTIAYFSSDGPTADGRVKPELLALGIGTDTVDPFSSTGYTTASGTSLSTPLVACAVACLIDARPYWTVDQMRQYLFETADYYVANGTYDPLYIRGYGIVDAYAANDTCSDAGVVELDRSEYMCESTVTITVIDCGLDIDPGAIDTVVVDIDSDSETGVEQVTLTELGPDAAQFEGTIDLSETNSPGVLLVAPGDTVTVTYIDADDGEGHYNVVVTATATVDCQPPNISNIQTTNVEPHSATVTFDADEPVRGTVHYGLNCGSLTETAIGSGYSTTPTVGLTGLQDNTTYFYTVEAEDEAGNIATDDNGGACYTFTTPEVPDFFTEQDPGDLDGLKLIFVPNGSNDFYIGCVEDITALPTDPTGGTTISLSDDDSELISFSGGAQVSLYGVSYSSCYV
ncbi:MAG: S8 family serine peptidase, partial [Phycisphaerae bacterium]|nr:S8 family serine peptidase [Phycisphaerae bacterium]